MVQSGFVVRTGEEQQQNVTSRLALLQSARAAHPMDRESELVFISNRDDATAFVRGIVGRARQKVLFVDPYFSFTDIRQFALSVALDQCEIGFLTGRDEPKWQNELQAFTPPVVHGRAMLTDLMHINQLRTENGLSSVTARVMGGPARKYHDRFLVVDDEVWHFGHSFNAIGDGSITLVMKVLRPEKILPLIIDDFTSAVSFESYWAEALSTQNSSAIKDVNQDQVSQDPCAAHWASRALNYIRSLMSFRRSADAGDRADP
jgi:hypothetical protein